MTNNSKSFYEAFEIEPKKYYSYDNWDCKKELDCGVEPPAMKFKCPNCENYLYIGTIVEDTYPPSTSDIVLGLFKIILDSGKDLLFTRDTTSHTPEV